MTTTACPFSKAAPWPATRLLRLESWSCLCVTICFNNFQNRTAIIPKNKTKLLATRPKNAGYRVSSTKCFLHTAMWRCSRSIDAILRKSPKKFATQGKYNRLCLSYIRQGDLHTGMTFIHDSSRLVKPGRSSFSTLTTISHLKLQAPGLASFVISSSDEDQITKFSTTCFVCFSPDSAEWPPWMWIYLTSGV